MNLSEYLKNNIPLLIVFVLIIALIIVLAVLLILQLLRKKKKVEEITETTERSEPENSDSDSLEVNPQESDEGTPAPETESEPEITIDESVETEPEQTQTEIIKEEDAMKKTEKEEKKPVKTEPKKTNKPVIPPVKGAKNPGKWIIYEEDRGGYGFRLVASNGEQMLKSSSPYASLSSAKSGIKTYQDNIAAGRLEINETKNGNFFVQINNASNRLLATSADYKSRSSCESAADSIKRWASTAVIVVESDEENDKK